jgi:hypothetical protein
MVTYLLTVYRNCTVEKHFLNISQSAGRKSCRIYLNILNGEKHKKKDNTVQVFARQKMKKYGLIQNISSGIHLQGKPQKVWYNWCSNTAKLGTFYKTNQTYDTCPSKSNLGTILSEGTEVIVTAT